MAHWRGGGGEEKRSGNAEAPEPMMTLPVLCACGVTVQVHHRRGEEGAVEAGGGVAAPFRRSENLSHRLAFRYLLIASVIRKGKVA